MPRWIVWSFLAAYVFAWAVVLGTLYGCGGGDPPPPVKRERDNYVRPKAQ